MLKRITSIKGIGPYANCAAGAAEFRKTALVFGYNSYGKSTLCELLRSLETGDTSEISVRGTIPGSVAQRATLTFSEDGKPELPVSLSDKQWNPASPGPFKVQVFDSGFVARNLFAGGRADRSNKEALSKFVLGEQGVLRSNQIAEMRKQLATARSDRRKLHDQLKSVGDVDAFVKLQVIHSEAELKAELESLAVTLDQAKKRLAVVEQIQGRPLLRGLDAPVGDPTVFERLNVALGQSLSSAHGTAREQLERHVNEHMVGMRSGMSWIRQGMDLISGPCCPFCEQPLDQSPAGLIDAYRQYFDEDFRRQSAGILDEMSAFDNAVKLLGTSTQESGIQKNTITFSEYRELDEDEAFKVMSLRLNELGKNVVEASSALQRVFHHLHESAVIAIRRKRVALHEVVEPLDISDYQRALEQASNSVVIFNQHCDAFNELLRSFKKNSDKTTLEAEVTELRAKTQTKQLQLRRVASAVTCDQYKKTKDRDRELEVKIKTEEDTLTNEQSDYLKKFFERINYYFTKFGSQHFSIGIDEKLDKQGYQPVLSLVVKYHGIVIEPQNLGSVFSESDRRALALSIFWAKISVLSEEVRGMTIVVLDDPVTSFDDNRISSAVILMRSEATTLRQLIMFTHYHAFARHWLEVERVSGTVSFHQLTRNAETTGLVNADQDEFLHSEQQKLYQKFVDFIEGKTQEPIGVELRVYFENEVRDRYRRQLVMGGMQPAALSDVIKFLAETGVVSSDIAKKAHFFREDLNGPHHVLAARGREDWASLALMMLEFIYNEL